MQADFRTVCGNADRFSLCLATHKPATEYRNSHWPDEVIFRALSPAADPDAPKNKGLIYETVVELNAQELIVDGERLTLTPGMQVVSEINLGTRTGSSICCRR